jgi:tetratricopeptide (TPR) repeat protein
MRPILVLAGTFLTLSLSQLFAAELSWLSFDEALTKARAERNVILVELRGCPQAAEGQETPKCHPPSAETTAKISSSPILANAMREFIRARVEVGNDNSPNISYLLAQSPPIPAAALVDPSGTIVATWRLDDASIHLNNLNVARKNKAPMLKSYDLRAKGAHREADLLLGDVNLTMGHAHKALKIYERTIIAFDTAGEADRARATRLRIENVRHLLGRQRVAIAEAERLLRDAPPAVAAEGYLIIGEMYARDKAQALAVDAYRRALEIAPAGSPHSVTARRALLRLGETTDVPVDTG